MSRNRAPEGNPANRRIDRPEDAKERRSRGDATAATRLAAPKARLGGELAGGKRATEDSETADALKRAAENEGRT